MKKYFVIGNPIDHSLSPKLHNYWINKNDISAIYDKKKLNEDQIENFISEIKKEKIAGANVTVPFKKSVIPYLDELSFEAKETQSVNTVVFNKNKLVGYNTDVVGFENAIKNIDFKINNKRIFILGAGGVVPSIIFALKKMSVSKITISNRTKQKAENLKKQFKELNILNWGEIPEFDLIINATSVGLNNESIGLDFSNTGKKKLFFDVIYNPRETIFLKTAKQQGNKTENGKLMFIYQALLAFNVWHGIKPEINDEVINLLDQ